MTFKDLEIGDRFVWPLAPWDIWARPDVYVKVSSRRYQNASGMAHRVGTVSVAVTRAEDIEDVSDEHWREDGDDTELFMGGY
jgi:hypothetical protein